MFVSRFVGVEVWSEDEDDLDLDALFDGSTNHQNTRERCLTSWLVHYLLRLQSQHYIPDSAFDSLLKFLHSFFVVLGHSSETCKFLSQYMPRTVYSMKKLAGLSDDFKRLVVCPECNSVYPLPDCVERLGVSKSCTHKPFPKSPWCGCILLKTVELASGKRVLYPKSVYCYNSVKSSLERLFSQADFFHLCEKWRGRTSTGGILSDIYDGNIWKEFQVVSGEPFLASPYCLGFSLNVDWFQPYKLTQSSVGVVYLTILNLPRSVRNRRQYVLLVGVIPGPHEPKRDINAFLRPLVEELKLLWSGQYIQVASSSEAQLVRCALLCVACDLPASKKVAGFLSHTANLGCSKCLKTFPGDVGNKDYSGFVRSLWPPRSNSNHRSSAIRTKKCPNKTQRQKMESELGCRYSVLLELSYFDPVRMVVIDPMHNIFLGSAKHVTKRLLIDQNIIRKDQLVKMQEFVDDIHVPPDIGRIPRKLESGFSGFTAAQFKNWVNLFSVPVLHGVIDDKYMEYWRHLVLASRLLCKYSLTSMDITVADTLLVQFCKKTEETFGKSAITPNMHLHGHLKTVIEDFGPLHGFWLFAYERYNGILGNYPSNNKSIEAQLMKKFLNDSTLHLFQEPEEFSEDFHEHFQKFDGPFDPNTSDDLVFPPKHMPGVLEASDIASIQTVLSRKLGTSTSSISVNSCFKQYSYLQIHGKMFHTCMKKSSHNFISLAEWDINIFGQPRSRLPKPTFQDKDQHIRPIEVHHFAKITYTVEDTDYSETFAVASWFSPHPDRYKLGRPANIWCKSVFEISGPHSFVPYNLIKSRCAYAFRRLKELDNEYVLIVVGIIE